MRSRSRSPGRRNDSRERGRRDDFRGGGARPANSRGGGRGSDGRVDAFGRQRRDGGGRFERKFYGLDPLPTMEAFRQQERDPDLTRSLDARYKAYKSNYMERLSTAFFDAHHKSEWFKERYGAKEVADRLDAQRAWAHRESALFAAQARRAPGTFVASADLGPAAEGDSTWAAKDGKKRPIKPLNEPSSALDADALDAKAILGHGGRAVFIRRVPAWCTATVLAETIEAEAAPFERLVLSDAVRNKNNEFSCSAWVIFATVEEARLASRRLHKAVITALSAADAAAAATAAALATAAAGDDAVAAANAAAASAAAHEKFEVQAFAHRARGFLQLEADMSLAARVAHDTKQAVILAQALDEQKGILDSSSSSSSGENDDAMDADEEQSSGTAAAAAAVAAPADADVKGVSFATLIQEPAVAAAIRAGGPCALLDLACAYLRRVHFYLYYTGVQCTSEGDLLNNKSHRRSAPYKEPATGSAEEAAVAAATAAAVEGVAEPVAAAVTAPTVSAAGAAAAARQAATQAAAAAASGSATGGAEPEQAAEDSADADSMAVDSNAADTADADADATADGGAAESAGDADSTAAIGVLAAAVVAAGPAASSTATAAAAKKPCKDGIRVDNAVKSRLLELQLALEDRVEGGKPAAARIAYLEDEEKQLQAWLQAHTLPTDESHARCGMPECGKLFKDASFVHKHLKNKHAEQVAAVSTAAALPYIRAAYNADPDKPFPAIPLEQAQRTAPHNNGNSSGGYGAGNSNSNRDRDYHTRDYDPRDRRDARSRSRSRDNDGRRSPGGPQSGRGGRGGRGSGGRFSGGRGGGSGAGGYIRVAAKHEDNVPVDPRQILSYVDVDAPQVSAVSLDYGGAFPPPKKKKKTAAA